MSPRRQQCIFPRKACLTLDFVDQGIGALVLDLLAGIAQQKGVDHAEEAALSASVLVVGPRGTPVRHVTQRLISPRSSSQLLWMLLDPDIKDAPADLRRCRQEHAAQEHELVA